jgi:hypothetical protein
MSRTGTIAIITKAEYRVLIRGSALLLCTFGPTIEFNPIMKKFLKIAGIVFLFALAVVIALPFLFKDKIVETVKDNVNASLNAKVDFGDFDLTLIPNFPNFTFQIENITIDGVAPFDSIRLASIGEAAFTLDIMSVIKGEKMRIQGIHVDKLFLNAIVLEDGTANYDIMKETETAAGDSTDVRDEYVILLEKYSFTNAHIIYDNRSMQMFVDMDGLDHSGKGDLSDKIYDLFTITTMKKLDVIYEGTQYMKNADAEINATFDIQDDFRVYNLKENEIRVNELYLTASGVVLMPEDGVDMDITYQSTKTDLKNVLSLVPADYMPDLEGLKTEGKVTLNGDVKGRYDDLNLPGFSVIGKIENGRIQYPELPKSIDNINTDLAIIYPGGADLDAMTFNIDNLHMEVANSPINLSFFTKNMMTDPFIKTDIKAQVNMANVKEAIVLEGVKDLAGIITADVSIEGRMSAIEAERYEDFKAIGKVIMQDFVYAADSVPDTKIQMAIMDFSPQFLSIPELKMSVGKTNIAAQGRLDNYLAYYLKDETIQGSFNVQSDLIDMNEWTGEEAAPAEVTSSVEETPMAVVEVPGNVDFDLNANIKKLVYGDMVMDNVKGKIQVKEHVASMQEVTMNMLGGTLRLKGSYSTLPGEAPAVDFGFDIKGFDIPSTANTFATVKALAPIAKQSQGNFSSGMTFKAALDQGMNPLYSTLQGGGNLLTNQVILGNFPALTKIASALKQNQWASQKINDVKLTFEFVDGKVLVKPFDIKLDGMEANVGGTMSFEQDLDYSVKMKVPTAKLGGQANQLMEGLVGKANSLGLNLSVGEFVNMNFLVTGKVSDPQVKPTILGQEGSAGVKDMIKETIKQEFDKAKEEVIDDAKERARAEADKLMAEARVQADRLKSEASKLADETKKQGGLGAKRLVDEAKNPLTKAAAKLAGDKLKQEADRKAQGIIAEGDKQAENAIKAAQTKADQLLQ